MALSVSRNPYTGLPDLVGTGGGGGGATFSGGMSTLGNTSGNTGFGTNRLVLAGGNNITLSGSTNGGAMTITISGGAGGGGGIAAAAGTQTATSGTVNFANSNGITFGMSNSSQVTASYTVPSTAGLLSAVNFSAGTTSNNTSQISFANGNGVSFGLNAGTITASHNGLTSQSNQALSGSNGSFTFQTATFGNLNGLSFYTSNGSLVGSHNGLTSQSNPAFSASGGSSTFQTLNFANSNGLTFSNSNGSVVGSYTVPTQSAQTVGAYAVSNTTGAASSTTLDARSFSFQGAGIASVGMTNGSVVISVPSGGGAGDGGNVLAAGTQTANTTGTVVFSNSNGVTFGMSNSSVITASVEPQITYSFYDPALNYNRLVAQLGQGSMQFAPCTMPNVTWDRIVTPVILSNSSNSTGTVTVSYSFGLYTKNASTLSLLASTSETLSVSFSGTVSTTHYTGMRNFSAGWSTSVSQGLYYFGFWSRTTTGGTNCSISNAVQSNIGSAFSGMINASSNSSQQYYPGQGVYSATFSTAMPSSVALSHIQGTAITLGQRPVVWYVTNGSY